LLRRIFTKLTGFLIRATTATGEGWFTINVTKGKRRRSTECQGLPGVVREDFPEELAAMLNFGGGQIPVGAVPVYRGISEADYIHYVYHLTKSNLGC
jgi:hypothetical protein